MSDFKTKRFYIGQCTDSGRSKGITIHRLDGESINYRDLEQVQILVAASVEKLIPRQYGDEVLTTE